MIKVRVSRKNYNRVKYKTHTKRKVLKLEGFNVDVKRNELITSGGVDEEGEKRVRRIPLHEIRLAKRQKVEVVL